MSTYNVTTYAELKNKVEAAVLGDTIYIGASITCTAQIVMSGSGII